MTQFISDPSNDGDDDGMDLFKIVGIGLASTIGIPFILGVACRFWYGVFLFGWHVFPPL